MVLLCACFNKKNLMLITSPRRPVANMSYLRRLRDAAALRHRSVATAAPPCPANRQNRRYLLRNMDVFRLAEDQPW